MDNAKPSQASLTPTVLTRIVGQQSVVNQLSVALDAAAADGRKVENFLLVGPPGLGKTLLATVLATEMAAEIHEALGQAIANVSDLNGLLLAAKEKDVVFIDEAHELRSEFQTAMYKALDQREIQLSSGTMNHKPHRLPLCDFTLVLATTDEYCLLQPLRDRMKIICRMEFYSVEELTELLRQRIHYLQWAAQESLLPAIAERARGTPRIAIRLLESARRVCRSEGESSLTIRHFERALALDQIDKFGLDKTEQQYLRCLFNANGPLRLNVLASKLSLPARTVSNVVEPYLIRENIISKTNGGQRELTPKGYEHVASQKATSRSK